MGRLHIRLLVEVLLVIRELSCSARSTLAEAVVLATVGSSRATRWRLGASISSLLNDLLQCGASRRAAGHHLHEDFLSVL